MSVAVEERNPLLRNALEYPLFAEISHDHVAEAVARLVADVEQRIVDLENDPDGSFSSVYRQLEDISVEIGRIWSPVSHLQHVKNSAELRAVYDKAQLQIVELNLRLNQSEIIYRKLFKLGQNKSLTDVQRRIVDLRLRDADLAGISLKDKKRQRFNAINEELTRLSTKFENNTLDSLKEFELILTTADQIAGLPASFLRFSSQSYRIAKKNQESTPETGPWLVTLDAPSYVPFMEYSERRDLREKLYRARITIASQGPFDNSGLLCDILRLRQEQARLLGFNNYADLSVSVKMAGRTERVKQLLDELHAASHRKGKDEYAELVAYARQCGQQEKFAHWDVSYWIRRLEKNRFDLDEEKLRRYFPLPRVLAGTFKLCQTLFNIEVREHTSEVQVWHDDVKFYRIYKDGEQVAAFYFDPYSRPQNKLSGAWMGTLTDRRQAHGKLEKPLCYVVCNFTPPVGNEPSLLTFWEVITLFHELGHALHGMLTTIDHVDISGGSGVEWDAIELPSQFMENFCYLDSVIRGISQHVDSGEPLPPKMLQQLQNKRTFRAASKILRQLFFGQTDLQLHEHFDPDSADPFAVMRQVAEQTLPVTLLESDRFLCSFGHIFAGGYAAGYYSYKWAEVLSADAFSLFRENGLETPQQLRKSGLHYRDTILALGGSMHPDTLYQKFRGRPPTTEALLQEYGLA